MGPLVYSFTFTNSLIAVIAVQLSVSSWCHLSLLLQVFTAISSFTSLYNARKPPSTPYIQVFPEISTKKFGNSSLVAPVSSYNSEFATRHMYISNELILLSQLGSWAQVKWTLISGIILVIFSETKRIFVNFQDIEERARKEALELMIVKEVFMNDFEFIIYAFLLLV